VRALCFRRNHSRNARWGLETQIVQKLDEIRSLLVVMSHVEAVGQIDAAFFPNRSKLEDLGPTIEHEPAIQKLIGALERNKASRIVAFFNTDRAASYQLVDFVTILLSLYQSTDSSLTKEPWPSFGRENGD
jgi:hypothetical protein